MVSDPQSEREAVAQIFAQQDEAVQQHIRAVLEITRRKMHLRNFGRGLVDLYSNALDKLVKE